MRHKILTAHEHAYIQDLYTLYSKDLFYLSLSYKVSPFIAEDAVQFTFEKALYYIDSVMKVPKDRIFFYLRRMLSNSIESLRCEEKKNLHQSLENIYGELSISLIEPNDYYLESIDIQTLHNVIEKLPDIYQDIISLYYGYELSYPEISVLLNISVDSAKQRCRTARNLLKQKI